MPELPEVETTRRGIQPHLLNQTIHGIQLRQKQLRWPIPATISRALGQRILAVDRRGKYILIRLQQGGLMLHLGMSGSLRIRPAASPHGKHDHVDIELGERLLRFNDPRRFGALLWLEDDSDQHPLLRNLGPEPLGPEFSGGHLWQASRHRRSAVKNFIMNSRIVVGVGNIYASEALYRAGIHPQRAAGRISRSRYGSLAGAVRDVLQAAIRQGGTTLRDFSGSDGQPGYFKQELAVYGRSGSPCLNCGQPVRQKRIGQRASYYCVICQR